MTIRWMSALLNGLFLLAAVLAVIAGITVALSLTLGRRLARRSRALAIAACGLAVPLAIVALAYAQYALTLSAPGDGPAIGLAGLLIIAVLSAPAGLVAAALSLWRGR